jgi:hypothetical protein
LAHVPRATLQKAAAHVLELSGLSGAVGSFIIANTNRHFVRRLHAELDSMRMEVVEPFSGRLTDMRQRINGGQAIHTADFCDTYMELVISAQFYAPKVYWRQIGEHLVPLLRGAFARRLSSQLSKLPRYDELIYPNRDEMVSGLKRLFDTHERDALTSCQFMMAQNHQQVNAWLREHNRIFQGALVRCLDLSTLPDDIEPDSVASLVPVPNIAFEYAGAVQTSTAGEEGRDNLRGQFLRQYCGKSADLQVKTKSHAPVDDSATSTTDPPKKKKEPFYRRWYRALFDHQHTLRGAEINKIVRRFYESIYSELEEDYMVQLIAALDSRLKSYIDLLSTRANQYKEDIERAQEALVNTEIKKAKIEKLAKRWESVRAGLEKLHCQVEVESAKEVRYMRQEKTNRRRYVVMLPHELFLSALLSKALYPIRRTAE